MPYSRAGGRLETDEAVGEKVVSVPLAAIVVVRRRAEGQIDVAELRVGAHDRPHVHPADRAPRLTLPGLGTELIRLRDGVEDPSLRTGADVEGADMPRRHVGTQRPRLDGRADDHQIADHQWRRRDRVPSAIARARAPLGKIYTPLGTEARDRRSSSR